MLHTTTETHIPLEFLESTSKTLIHMSVPFPVYMGNSSPATDISWDAAFLLRVIPNMVRSVYKGAWEPSSIVVWVLMWFGKGN